MSKDIFINDLAQPILNKEQRSIVESLQKINIKLNKDEILAEACEITALNDFGSMDFEERLSLLCNAWNANVNLTSIGLLSLRAKLTQFAANRLLIHQSLVSNPQIEEVKIVDPIIVVGLPRSGTTHLLNLLAADKRLRSLPLWESYEPIQNPNEPQNGEINPRYTRCNNAWEMMQKTVPLLSIMHPMHPEHIHEELELMGPDFASYNFEWLCQTPEWRDHYFSSDQTKHYQYMKNVLKILTWQDGDKDGSKTRWVLKCPQHLEQLAVLKKTFPDAKVIFTHRDPVSVIQSTITMIAYGHRMSRKKVDLNEVYDYWSERVMHLLKACVQDRQLISGNDSLDIYFHEFINDEIKTIQSIYQLINLDLNDDARDNIFNYSKTKNPLRHGKIVYNLKENFGKDAESLRARFKFYFDAFAIQPDI